VVRAADLVIYLCNYVSIYYLRTTHLKGLYLNTYHLSSTYLPRVINCLSIQYLYFSQQHTVTPWGVGGVASHKEAWGSGLDNGVLDAYNTLLQFTVAQGHSSLEPALGLQSSASVVRNFFDWKFNYSHSP
jgi:hypothetical protein